MLSKIKEIAAVVITASLLQSPAFAEDVGKLVVPGGQSVGVSLSFGGAYVDDLGDIELNDGTSVSPAREAGIRRGDIITSLNGVDVETVDDFNKLLNRLGDNDEARLTINRGNDTKEVTLNPARAASDNRLKIGAWIMDAASGVGTITFYDPGTGEFAAVGHSIGDAAANNDSSVIGDVYKADIVGIRRGESGTPGELIGIYSENRLKVGEINSSSEYGIIGTVSNPENLMSVRPPIILGSRDDVHTGEARICANIEGSRIEEYTIEITDTKTDGEDEKDIIFKVTDEELIAKTGGIVRGMSGSPIIQDDKIVGSVTHVLVNQPTMGYGIFIENMKK